MEKQDNVFKVVFVGVGCTGKTSLINRYKHRQFSDCVNATLMFKNNLKDVEINGSKISLDIMEMAGEVAASFNRLNSALSNVYGTADGLVIVFDVTNRASFSWVPHMMQEINVCTKDQILVKLLIGNKTDLVEKRVIDCEEAHELAKNLGMSYVETSAKDDTNVTEAFKTLAENFLKSKTKTPVGKSKDSQSCCIVL